MKTIKQVLAISLSHALLISSLPTRAFSAPALPSFTQTLTPPARFGSIVSSNDFGRSGMPRLIVIADLHGHIGVQKNIVGMLETFVDSLTTSKDGAAQKQVPIFVEGGWLPNLEFPLQSVADPKVRSLLSGYLLGKAELSAGQFFSEQRVGARNFTINGVENKDEYDANRARFKETYPMRKAVLEAISKQEKPLAVLRNNVEGRAFLKVHKLREEYQKGLVTGEKYARVLVRQAHREGIQAQSIELLKNPKISQGEFDLALSDAHRLVAQALSKSRPLSSYLRENLKNEATIRENLAYIDTHLELLKRTVANQLTPEEVAYAMANLPHMIQVARILLADQELGFDLEKAIQRSLDFYPFAFMRDESLVKNSLAALNADSQTPTGILITGGFHTAAITQRLEQQRVPYMLVNPNVDREISSQEQLNYVKRICDEPVTAEEARLDFAQVKGRRSVQGAIAAPYTNLDALKMVPGAVAVVATLNSLTAPAKQIADQIPSELTAKTGIELASTDAEDSVEIQGQVGSVLRDIETAITDTDPETQFFTSGKTKEEQIVMHLMRFADKELPEALRNKVVVTSDRAKFEQGRKSNDGKYWLFVEKNDVNITSFGTRDDNAFVAQELKDQGVRGNWGRGFKFVLTPNGYQSVGPATEEMESMARQLNQMLAENTAQQMPKVVYVQEASGMSTSYRTAKSQTQKSVPHSAFIVNPRADKVIVALRTSDINGLPTASRSNPAGYKVTGTGRDARISDGAASQATALEQVLHEFGHIREKHELANTMQAVVRTVGESARIAGIELDKGISADFVVAVLHALNPAGTRPEINILESKILELNVLSLTVSELTEIVQNLFQSRELKDELVQELASGLQKEMGIPKEDAERQAQEFVDQATIQFALYSNGRDPKFRQQLQTVVNGLGSQVRDLLKRYGAQA